MAPIISEEEEQKENVPKVLCQMDNHLACVNSVRWSSSGKYLASGGDDKVIMIWTIGARYVGSSSSAFGRVVNVEQWKCITTLRGHSGDILDLSWSPADNWLASCSVDNNVVIWNTQKWPEMVTILKGHTGLVKGVSWDPIGKYVASQSDDKSLRIWRVNDWAEETVVSEPFVECGGTTHVLRLNWSPDGQFLVSAHAMNNSGSVAQIIERQGWKISKDFVGHRKAITCVKFNPHIFWSLSDSNKSRNQKLCCAAIGSRDRSLSIWLTSRRRPLCVIHDLFDNSVLDFSWAQNGYQLIACSWDGTIAYLEFEENEIGNPLSNDEKLIYKQKLYGRTTSLVQSSTLLIEDAEMLKIREEQQKSQQNGLQSGSNESSSKALTNDSKCSQPLMKGPTDKQIETRMADGRRRITPLYIPPVVTPDGVPQPFNASQIFSSSRESKTNIVIEKRDLSNSSSSNLNVNSQQQSQQLSKALPNMNTDPIKVTNQQSTPATTNKQQNCVVENGNSSTPASAKRKSTNDQSYNSSKRKPGRPPQKEMSKPTTVQTPVAPSTQVESVNKSRSIRTESKSNLPIHLPPLKMEKISSTTIHSKKNELDNEVRVVVDVENNVNSSSLSALRLNENEERKWEVLISARISGLAGNEQLIAVACDDNTLSVFNTSTGRRLQSPIIINNPAARLACFGQYVMLITTKAILWMWDFNKLLVVIKAESLLPLFIGAGSDVTILSSGITNNGSPIVSISTGKTFVFNESFSCWTLISNANDLLNHCTNQKPHSFDPSSLPLTTIQSQHR